MLYIQAPAKPVWSPHPSLFLAGGITGTECWQTQAAQRIGAYADSCGAELVILDPRRAVYIDTPEVMKEQICWEYRHMQSATAIVFWFPPETLCPIALFELGKWVETNKLLVVGCDPAYKRLGDLQIQLQLSRPGLLPVHVGFENWLAAVQGLVKGLLAPVSA